MKTKKEVQNRLKERKEMLKETNERFDEYDNHDDLDLLRELEAEVDALNWVLRD